MKRADALDMAVALQLPTEHHDEFARLFVGVEAGGCAPPVYVETERQADQRIADELREARFRSTVKERA